MAAFSQTITELGDDVPINDKRPKRNQIYSWTSCALSGSKPKVTQLLSY
jgi:hypothetical protein